MHFKIVFQLKDVYSRMVQLAKIRPDSEWDAESFTYRTARSGIEPVCTYFLIHRKQTDVHVALLTFYL